MNNFNWQRIGVAFFSALTMLAALPYSMGDIATIIPPTWKPKIVTLGLIATFILHSWYGVKPPAPPTITK